MVTEFLTVEGSSPIEIRRHLRSLCGEDAIDVSSVRHWVHYFKSGEKDIGDRPHNSQPAQAAMTETKDKLMQLFGMTAASQQVNCELQ
jgi:hypothetical protein